MICALMFLTPVFEYIPQVCFQLFIGHWYCLKRFSLIFNESSTLNILQMTYVGILMCAPTGKSLV